MSELVRVVTQCGHLVGDTIVQGSATSHMVPVDQADGEFIYVCSGGRERGKRKGFCLMLIWEGIVSQSRRLLLCCAT